MIPLLNAVASNSEPTPRAPFAIVEIHVRDTPEQTRASLTQAGYEVVSVTQSASMRQKLLNARANQLHRPVQKSRFLAVDSIKAVFDDQEITVRLDDDASGARVVVRVSYVASDLAHPYPRVGRALLDRYGTPTKQRPQSAVWCVVKDDSCDAGGIPQTDMLVGQLLTALGAM